MISISGIMRKCCIIVTFDMYEIYNMSEITGHGNVE